MHASPLLPARDCPPELMPSGVKQAVKQAETGGWRYRVTYAIGPLPEGAHSVVFIARRGPVVVSSRHEARANEPKKMGFVSGWRSPGRLGIPDRLGWRQVLAELKLPACGDEKNQCRPEAS